MSTEDDDKHNRIPTFKGDKDKYAVFKIRFEAWEKHKKVSYVSSTDHDDELPTQAEYERRYGR